MFGKLLKSTKLFLVLGIIFSALCFYVVGHIIYWYVSTSTSAVSMDTMQREEVVGVEVPETVTSLDEASKKSKELPFVSVDFTELKKRNTDIVAWLKLGAVNLDIPIVQTVDNEFYLDHDVDKKSNKLGWVFFDTRSNTEFLGYNTVLYGHNAANKQMFGSLKDLYETDPERVDQDRIIQLTTPYDEMVFEIVSVYVTDYEDWHYVNHIFSGIEAKQEFIDLLRSKNELPIFDKKDLSTQDNFLTFSTCYGPAGTTERLVVHARLVGSR